jgi:hypothetical protein
MRKPENTEAGLVTVSLPRGTSTSGKGFSFQLPQALAEAASNERPVRVTSASGGSLPSWLRYASKTKNFVAAPVPGVAFPYEFVVRIGDDRTRIMISERRNP